MAEKKKKDILNDEWNIVNDEIVINTEEKSETYKILEIIFKELDETMKNKDPLYNKIISGYNVLDQLLLGFYKGDLNIIASRPGIGKTLFAMSMFTNIVKQGINALYISFEKNETDLMKNIIAISANISSHKLDSGLLSRDDYKNIIDGLNKLNKCENIFLKTLINTDLLKLKDFIKEEINKNDIKIVFIDYLHLIVPAPTYSNRWEQVCEISRSLKTMAMEFNVPFVVLCPIHRNVEDDKPEMNDLSESGSIENEADRIMILFNKKKKKPHRNDDYIEKPDEKIISLYIAKNRRGATTTIDFLFDYKKKNIKIAEPKI